MNVLIIVNFITAIIAFLTLTWKRHPLMALAAMCCILLYGYGLWNVGLNINGRLCQMLHAEECYGKEVAYPVLMGGWSALMLSNVCLALYPWLKRWAVVLWMLLVIASGLAVSMFSPLNVIEGLYAVCCAIMCEMTIMSGLSYLEFTVLGNIYLQSLLPTLFALPALWASARSLGREYQHKYLPLLLSGIWFVLNLSMTIAVWSHYIHLTLEEAGRLCVGELKDLSGHTWSGYVTVNILIFFVAFLIDAIISWLLYRYAKHHLQRQERKSSK